MEIPPENGRNRRQNVVHFLLDRSAHRDSDAHRLFPKAQDKATGMAQRPTGR
jgi:hypothetical protein